MTNTEGGGRAAHGRLEEQIQTFSDEQLQSFFVESDSSVAEELFGPCFGQ